MKEHEAKALLSNFGLKCFHSTGDGETAKYASDLLGEVKRRKITYNPKVPEDMGEEIFGQSSGSCSLTEAFEPVLQPRVFMSGLRTGGRSNGYVVDGILIRSGEPFYSGENWLKVAFSQK
jgi:hypothetical protein